MDIDPNSAKGLYRLGKAKRELANYEEARKYFIKAQSVSDDPEIGRQVWSLEFSMGGIQCPLQSVFFRSFELSNYLAKKNRVKALSTHFLFVRKQIRIELRTE